MTPLTQNNSSTTLASVATAETHSWQRELAGAVRTSEDLLRRLGLLNPGEAFIDAARRFGLLAGSEKQLQHFPVLVPESYLSRMKSADINDPLLKQVLPLADETASPVGFVTDAVGDLNARRAPGVLQKYQGRVLLIATSTCAVHCRYCFRREYPYESEPRRLDDWQPSIDMIAADESISEVIFSGGDPWMLNDQRLEILCRAIDAIPHVERIRFHTRLPIVLPSRVTDSLLTLLTSLRAQAIVVVHANHGQEVADDCEASLRRLAKSGIPVLNQAVLLRGVNDSVEALESLCRKLTAIGIMPYYLHQLDRVFGTSHFEVSPNLGRDLIAELTKRLPGYAVPRYVQEIAGEPSKTPIPS